MILRFLLLSRLLEELPHDTRGQVLIDVADDDHGRNSLPLRESRSPGFLRHAGTRHPLLNAIQNLRWPEGEPFAWLAGEQAEVQKMRRFLVEKPAVPKSDIDFTGYWKRGAA